MDALDFSEKHLKKVIAFQKEIIEKIGKEKLLLETSPVDDVLEGEIKEFLGKKLEEALYQKDKSQRTDKIDELKEELSCFIEEKYSNLV
ncbi:unnamed protein product, partial [marine sediment metagenome]